MMNLRKARIDDHWRKIFKRSYSVSIKNVSFKGDPPFGDFTSDIPPGLTCLVGKNGIGKSTFIRSIHNALHSEGSNRNTFSINTTGEGEIYLEIAKLQETKKFTTSIGHKIKENSTDPITSFLFDPCSTIPTLQEMISNQDNLDELLEGYQERSFSQEEIKVISYLTGTIYKTVELIVVEDEFEAFSTFPFFRVSTNITTYDSRKMGLGEHSLFYFFWLLNYINKFEGEKILLIEEPESFIPPVVQEKVANILAYAISEYDISCILSTHSEHILKRVPRKNILIFRRNDKGLVSRVAADNFEHLKVLGLGAPKKGILFFEDSAAVYFFKTILKYSKEFVPDSFYYHKSGSEGDLVGDLKRFPSKIEEFKVIGIFDGDCRTRNLKLPDHCCFTFLPNTSSPEEVIIKHLESVKAEDLATIFNLPQEVVENAFDATHGCDHHDFFEILSVELKIPYEYLFCTLCDHWISQNDEEVQEFLRTFDGLNL